MRRFLGLLAVVVLAACEAAPTAPEAAPLNLDRLMAQVGNPVVASASGAAHFSLGDDFRRTSFTARTYADGSVEGQIQWQRDSGKVHATVTCMTIVGNRAHIGATVTTADDPARIGGDMVFIAEDNGQGKKPTDRLTLAYVGVDPAFGYADLMCSLDPAMLAALGSTIRDIEQGNIQIDG